jgi:signal transduction histidine kinase
MPFGLCREGDGTAIIAAMAFTDRRLLVWSGLLAWIMVGVPIALHSVVRPEVFYGWFAAYLLFGALFWWTASGKGGPRPFALLVVESACVLALVLLLCDGFEGALMVLVAMQLAGLVSRRTGLAWIAVQSLLLGVAIEIHWSLRPALLLAPPYLGFQVLAFLTFELLEREIRGRRELALANAELMATRELLAERSRLAERLRIARELHDAVGHHLVALSLNLEVAAHHAQGEAEQQVRAAQGLARLLLTDVGEIVSDLNQGEAVDLQPALAAMAAEIPRPAIHLAVDPELKVEDSALAHLLLRCCQEVVTNAVKHSAAENLWIELGCEAGAVTIRAHDDGQGASTVEGGHGLAGMRQRLEGAGGRLALETSPGRGFSIQALIPQGRAA